MFWMSWILPIFSMIGLWQLGKKRKWAWFYLGILEIVWAVYGIMTGQPGFILGSLAYMLIYIKNYRQWRKGS